MRIKYLDGVGLKRAVIAGARRVILMQDRLNRINVFPVPDNDTGTNMALTMQSIAEGAINCRDKSVSAMSQCLAESALMGARGNSGAILAQFFQGIAEKFKGHHRIDLAQFGEAVVQARNSSYEAITEPQEGTILTVIHDWAERIRSHCHQAHDFFDLLREGLQEAQRSLKETPKKLKLLATAGVVDAGAQGFVHMLEGIHHFLQSGKIEKAVGMGGAGVARAKVENAPQDITFRYCTECLIVGENIDRSRVRQELSRLGNSLIVAGSKQKVRVHVHTNEPQQVFELAGRYGKVKTIAIVTDSSCDLPQEFIIRHNIQMVPVQLAFGNQNYIDKITITPEEFYRLLEHSGHYPKTSQPSPGDFKNTFEQVLGHYDEIISINLSGAVSGTLQAARTAARAVAPDRIHVLDSKNTSVALGLIVSEAAAAVEQGCELEEVLQRTKRAIANARFFVAFSTVEYLIQGGRLGWSKGMLARTLHLNPILTLDRDGQVQTMARVVGERAALDRLLHLVERHAQGKRRLRFAVAHANAPDKAEWLKDKIARQFEVTDIITANVSPALGAHAGPGAAGVSFIGD